MFINSEISSEEKIHFRFEDCVQEPGVSGSSSSRKLTFLELDSDFWVSFSNSGSSFFDFLLLDFVGFLLFCLAMNPSKLKGPKAPNDERLMVAAEDADKG